MKIYRKQLDLENCFDVNKNVPNQPKCRADMLIDEEIAHAIKRLIKIKGVLIKPKISTK